MAAFAEEVCTDIRLARGTTEICTVVNTLHSYFPFIFLMTNDVHARAPLSLWLSKNEGRPRSCWPR